MATSAARRARGALAVATALATLAGCETPTVDAETFAYDPTGITARQVYHWPLGVTLAIYVDPTAAPPGDSLRRLVERGAAQWRDSLYYREFDVRIAESPADADVIVHHAAAPLLVATLDCAYSPFGGGYTFFCPYPSAENADSALVLPLRSGAPGRVKIDVRVNRAATDSDAEFAALVAHELGHAFGIGGHSPEPADLMFGAPRAPAPTADDARTLRWVLHQPASIRF